MDETLDTLPGENEVKKVTKIRLRRLCDNCGEYAHYKHGFLLPDCRSNRASSAYGKDDCSWCSDAHQFSCKHPDCQSEMKKLEGYEWAQTFSAVERFAHMFLYWDDEK